MTEEDVKVELVRAGQDALKAVNDIVEVSSALGNVSAQDRLNNVLYTLQDAKDHVALAIKGLDS